MVKSAGTHGAEPISNVLAKIDLHEFLQPLAIPALQHINKKIQ
jgi:hypothetical protein